MLPLYAYVITKAAVPNLCSEAAFMEAFISEYMSSDRGGYLLVTLQTCISLLSQLRSDQMEKNAREIIEKARKEETERHTASSPIPRPGTSNQGITLESLEKMLDDASEQ